MQKEGFYETVSNGVKLSKIMEKVQKIEKFKLGTGNPAEKRL